MKNEKLFIPIAIIIASLVIGGSYFAVQYIKLQSDKEQAKPITEKQLKIEANTETNIEDNARWDVEQSALCLKAGSEVYNKLKDDLGDGYSVFNPEYYFNKKLNTCLYFGGYLSVGDSDYFEKFVKDVYKNKDIILYISLDKKSLHTADYCGEACVSGEEFDRRKNILFNE